MRSTDKDLAAHFTIIKNACILLYGESKQTVFGSVLKADYLDSIKYNIKNAANEIFINPISTIQNLCCILVYAEEELILSKLDGSYWRKKSIPGKYSKYY